MGVETNRRLGVCGIICSAVSAVDYNAMHSVLLGVQQDRAALAADIVHGLVYLL
jgi:hypothetical protein